MSGEIWVAIITSLFSFLGVLVTVHYGNKKQAKITDGYKDVTLYRIGELEKKVEKHNNVMERTFRLEQDVKDLNNSVNLLRKVHLK